MAFDRGHEVDGYRRNASELALVICSRSHAHKSAEGGTPQSRASVRRLTTAATSPHRNATWVDSYSQLC
jgi:hypothetical protein